MFRFLILSAIRLYQRTLSPDHGIISKLFPLGYCRFNPTCSEYTHQAIEKYGVFRGSWLGFKRVLRCNPGSQSGDDPVPDLKIQNAKIKMENKNLKFKKK